MSVVNGTFPAPRLDSSAVRIEVIEVAASGGTNLLPAAVHFDLDGLSDS